LRGKVGVATVVLTTITGSSVVDTLVRRESGEVYGVTSGVGDGVTIDVENEVAVDVGIIGEAVLVTATTLLNSAVSYLYSA
jgi:hypothetical protein